VDEPIWVPGPVDVSELERLRTELARVRGERDRLFVTMFIDHQMETDQIGDRLLCGW
jgi:hypothetical protein